MLAMDFLTAAHIPVSELSEIITALVVAIVAAIIRAIELSQLKRKQ